MSVHVFQEIKISVISKIRDESWLVNHTRYIMFWNNYRLQLTCCEIGRHKYSENYGVMFVVDVSCCCFRFFFRFLGILAQTTSNIFPWEYFQLLKI